MLGIVTTSALIPPLLTLARTPPPIPELPSAMAVIALKTDTVAPEEPVKGEEAIPDKIKRYAQKYGVSEQTLTAMVSCETGGTFDPDLQSLSQYTRDHPEWGFKKGDREDSWGLAQIHLPAHPHISRDEATDPDFALEFLALNLARGKQSMWLNCWRDIHTKRTAGG